MAFLGFVRFAPLRFFVGAQLTCDPLRDTTLRNGNDATSYRGIRKYAHQQVSYDGYFTVFLLKRLRFPHGTRELIRRAVPQFPDCWNRRVLTGETT